LADDLNTAKALSTLHQLYADGDAPRLAATLRFLGFEGGDRTSWVDEAKALRLTLEPYGAALSAARDLAQKTKDFSEVDALKKMLIGAGAEVRMTKESIHVLPTSDFDPSKLEALE
jgi:cysteinyl-tRNA synthetase